MDPASEHGRRVGRTLNDKWTLGALLGVGGAGAVYAATHRNGRAAAVKILHRELTGDPEHVSRFLREGYIANQLAHPGVVQVIDDDITEDGLVYLVLELLEGRTLDDELARRGGSLPPEEALPIADAVLDVLAAAHDKGVVHRDVKPENVFLLAGGGVKVLDFGIAKAKHGPARGNATQVGAVFGTPGFMPPEQARGRAEQIAARTDVWAAGATLLLTLTGRRLHEAPTAQESLLRSMIEPAPAVATVAPWLPGDLAHLIDRALAFEPSERWRDARAMLAALRAVWTARSESRPSWRQASSRPGATPALRPVEVSAGPNPSMPPRPSWPAAVAGSWHVRVAITAAATAALGAVLGLGFLSSHAGKTPPPAVLATSPPPPSPLEIELTDADLAAAAAVSTASGAPRPVASAAPARTSVPPARAMPPRIRREDALRDRR